MKYDASSIKVITGAEAVRKRPGMYFGNLDSTGVNRVLFEVIANSIDQYLAKQSTMIRVEFEGGIIRISDDGKGLPFDKASPENDKQNLVEYYFTTLHTSATADLHAPHIHVNLIGVGLAAVNAVCKNISITSFNGQKKFNQHFGKGKIITPLTTENDTNPSGTSIEIRIDEKIFDHAKPDLISLRKTLFEIAHFYPGLIVHLNAECFCAENGLLDLAQIYYQDKPAQYGFEMPPRFSFEGQHENVWISAAAIGQENVAYSHAPPTICRTIQRCAY